MWTQKRLSGVTAFAKVWASKLKNILGLSQCIKYMPLSIIQIHTQRRGSSACLWSIWGVLRAICIGLSFLNNTLKYNRNVVFKCQTAFIQLVLLLLCPGSSSCLADALGCFPPGWISPFSCQHFCSLMTGFVSWYPLLMIMATEVYYRAM